MKTIVITGATSGIGLATARLLAGQGYRIIGVGRRTDACADAQANIKAVHPQANLRFYTADLMQRSQVLRLAEAIQNNLAQFSGGALHALINNAGCVRSWYMTTEEGYEQQFALNHLAGYLLTHALLPCLQKGAGLVIMTGSQSHRGARVHWNDVMLRHRYDPLTAYKQSKLCNLLFAKGLNDRYAALGIHAYVVDPGLMHTDIGDKAGGVAGLVWRFRKTHGAAPEIPAQTYAFLCAQAQPLPGLYYRQNHPQPYSKQVTTENANRLFALSQQLCGVAFPEETQPCMS